jgi:hypothetical protein
MFSPGARVPLLSRSKSWGKATKPGSEREAISSLFFWRRHVVQLRMGMGSGMDFPQLEDADFGVNLRGVEPGMSEHLLDEPDVRPVLQHVRGARVPEQVATPQVADVRFLDHGAHPVAQVRRTEPLAVIDKKSLFRGTGTRPPACACPHADRLEPV